MWIVGQITAYAEMAMLDNRRMTAVSTWDNGGSLRRGQTTVHVQTKHDTWSSKMAADDDMEHIGNNATLLGAAWCLYLSSRPMLKMLAWPLDRNESAWQQWPSCIYYCTSHVSVTQSHTNPFMCNHSTKVEVLIKRRKYMLNCHRNTIVRASDDIIVFI